MAAALRKFDFSIFATVLMGISMFTVTSAVIAEHFVVEVVATPGATVMIPAYATGHTELVFKNQGPGSVVVVIQGHDYSKSFVIKEGETMELLEFFRQGNIHITNKSVTATVNIRGKWI